MSSYVLSIPWNEGRGGARRVGERDPTENHRNFQMIPTDNKLGLPPAALKRSYSPRTASGPILNCAPAPPAKPTFARLSGAGLANAGHGWPVEHTIPVPAVLS